jgi:hypothetical protein
LVFRSLIINFATKSNKTEKMETTLSNRLHIRVSQQTMAFAAKDSTTGQVIYEPYIVRSGVSMAANLREAFRNSNLLNSGYRRAQLIVDTPTVLVPLQEFEQEQAADLYHHAISQQEGCEIVNEVLPSLNAVLLFAVNRDLRMVVNDHFDDVRLTHVMPVVWSHMQNRSYSTVGGRSENAIAMGRRKVYVYFHDKKAEVFSFDKNRFRFANTFEGTRSRDVVYFVLHVWKQLGCQPDTDELFLAYDNTQADTAENRQDREWILEALRRYVQKVYTVNPSAEFNRAPVTQVKGIPFDLMMMF